MSREEYVEQLFHAALDRQGQDLDDFLAQHCQEEDLRSEVRSLLMAYEKADLFMEEPVVPREAVPAVLDYISPPAATDVTLEGYRIGVWRVGKRLAIGGMGDVYLAERDDGQYDRQVAIKLMRQSITTDPVLRRQTIRQFRDERQHLAHLNHPNIAALIDGGTTEEGHPYLVMEYIQGLPINKYCDEQHLSLVQRLELFRIVCAAVQHAHNRFIAHRDLKPSNILVVPPPHDGTTAIPKLVDFGIAKLTKAPETPEDPKHTRFALRPLTPEYASPEQVSGEEVGTASDIYSLGVILYELATGCLPYRVTPYDAKAVICNEIPPRPSILRRSVGREFDAIVFKAMEKDPARRYPSAAALADDIDRYLDGRPLSARPPTVMYLLSKLLLRHKATVASFVFLFLAIGATTALVVTLSRQSRFLAFQSESLNRASRLYTIAENLESNERYIDAEMLLREAIAIEREVASESTSPGARAAKLTLLGRVLVKSRKHDEAEPVLREALKIWEKTAPVLSPAKLGETHRLLAECLVRQGRLQEAEWPLLECAAILSKYPGNTTDQLQTAYRDLVKLYKTLGRPADAEKFRGLVVTPTSRPTTKPAQPDKPRTLNP